MNMKGWLLGGLLGGLVFYVFLSLSWTVLPFHTMAFSSLPDSEPVLDALEANGLTTGLYTMPGMQEWEADPDRFARMHTEGPLVSFLVYYEEGRPPMSPTVFVIGIVLTLLEGLLAAGLLMLAVDKLPGYAQRVLFVAALGVFTALTGPVTLGNWMYFPAGYVGADVIDHVIGWTLAGLVMAVFVKPKPAAA